MQYLLSKISLWSIDKKRNYFDFNQFENVVFRMLELSLP